MSKESIMMYVNSQSQFPLPQTLKTKLTILSLIMIYIKVILRFSRNGKDQTKEVNMTSILKEMRKHLM